MIGEARQPAGERSGDEVEVPVGGLEELELGGRGGCAFARRREPVGDLSWRRNVGLEAGRVTGERRRELVHERVAARSAAAAGARICWPSAVGSKSAVQRVCHSGEARYPLDGVRAHQMFPAPGV